MTIFLRETGINAGGGALAGSAANTTAGPNAWASDGDAVRSSTGFKSGASSLFNHRAYIDAGAGQQKLTTVVASHSSGEMHVVFDKVTGSGHTYDSATGSGAGQLAIRSSLATAPYRAFYLYKRDTTTGAATDIWNALWQIQAPYTIVADWSVSGQVTITVSDGVNTTQSATVSTSRFGGQFAGIFFYDSDAVVNDFKVEGTSATIDTDLDPTIVGATVMSVTSGGAPLAGATVTSADTTALPSPTGVTDALGLIALAPAAVSTAPFNLTIAKSGYTSRVISVEVMAGAAGGGTLSPGISPTSFSVVENNTVVGALTTGLPGTPVWSISGGTDAAAFTINSATGALAFVAVPDYEHPTDAGGNNFYSLTISVTNGSTALSQAITVSVTNAPEVLTIVSNPVGNTGVPLVVTVLDEQAAPRAGVVLSWVGAVGGTISGVTDSAGQAIITPNAQGTFTLRAQIGAVTTSASLRFVTVVSLITIVSATDVAQPVRTSFTVLALAMSGATPAAGVDLALESSIDGVVNFTDTATTNGSGIAAFVCNIPGTTAPGSLCDLTVTRALDSVQSSPIHLTVDSSAYGDIFFRGEWWPRDHPANS